MPALREGQITFLLHNILVAYIYRPLSSANNCDSCMHLIKARISGRKIEQQKFVLILLNDSIA